MSNVEIMITITDNITHCQFDIISLNKSFMMTIVAQLTVILIRDTYKYIVIVVTL